MEEMEGVLMLLSTLDFARIDGPVGGFGRYRPISLVPEVDDDSSSPPSELILEDLREKGAERERERGCL